MHPPTLRLMTYNVHRCIGCDGVLSPARVAKVIASCGADLVALQELDVGHSRTDRADQPRVLAELLNMRAFFFPAIEGRDEHYGDAVLSRHPMDLVRAGPLPGRPGAERRGALWVAVEVHGRSLHVLNTHLGLDRKERLAQVEALLGPEWLGNVTCRPPRMLLGDLNTFPGQAAYRRLRRSLRDAQDRGGTGWPRNTFPSRFPLVRLDHVFHSPDVNVRRVVVPRTRWTRIASDHLPVVVEVSLP